MASSEPGATRPAALLWLAAVLALSVIGLHQMSSEHRAAAPRAALVASADSHVDSSVALHAGTLDTTDTAHRAGSGDTCSDCLHHSALALTCLAALTMLGGAVRLLVPASGVARQRTIPRVQQAAQHGTLLPRRVLTLVELSISRT